MKSIAILVWSLVVIALVGVAEATDNKANVPEDWFAQVQQQIAASEYHVSPQKGVFSAPNRAQDLRTYFTPEGPRVVRRTTEKSSWSWGLELVGYGAENSITPMPAKRVPVGNRMEYQRGELVEWYVNDAQGLEQGFTVHTSPSATPNATEFYLELAIRGDLLPRMQSDEQAITFVNQSGVAIIQYDQLIAWDAQSRTLPAHMELLDAEAEKRIRLVVDTTDAVYPITIDPLASSANWIVEGEQSDESLGSAVSTAGDVNGDGYSDVIVSAPFYDNGETDAGCVFVYYGSKTGLSTTPEWSQEGQRGRVFYGLAVSTAGDVNGDGYSDIIVGTHYYHNGETDEGAAFVYHGSSTGLSTTADWAIESNQADTKLGNAVSTAGDVNGDGYSDVIIGVRGYSNGEFNEGAVFVYYGSDTGLSSTADWTMEGNQADAVLGYSVSTAGDVNGDGYSDIISSACYYSNGETKEGAAFVYHGSSTGLSTTADWAIESDQANAKLGNSVSTAGDVNGDGYADVIVGAHSYSQGEISDGRAFVYYGSETGLSTTADWTGEGGQYMAMYGTSTSTAGDVNGDGYADVVVGALRYDNGENDEGAAFVYHGSATGLSSTANWMMEGNQAGAELGGAVSTAGDVNGDGYSDIIIGVHNYDSNTELDVGRAYVYHGAPTGLSQTEGWKAEGEQINAQLGTSVSTAGDVNGDGYDDVLVGAPFYDNGETDEGRAYVYHGSAIGLSLTANWVTEGNMERSRYGYSVSTAGDVNGDGYSDVIVGAHAYSDGETSEGRAYIYHGSASGLSLTENWTVESDQTEAYLGFSLSTAGDVNGDGYSDVVVGAHGYSNGETQEGAAFVYHGSETGLSTAADTILEGNIPEHNLGYAVSTAGDINSDGFSDLIITAGNLPAGPGVAYLYYGSEEGLPQNAAWEYEDTHTNSYFGSSLSTAGDVNGDGFSDVIIGAYNYNSQGAVFLFYGAENGFPTSPDLILQSGVSNSWFGKSLSTAGDVNGDGYSDVIIGSPYYMNSTSNKGAFYVYHGSATGLSSAPNYFQKYNERNHFLGNSVSTAGDVNGDGYADIIVGDSAFTNDQTTQGAAFVYYGNGGPGLDFKPQQRRTDNSAPIELNCKSDADQGVLLTSLARTPFGCGKVKLEAEIKPFGTPFDGTDTLVSDAWQSIAVGGTQMSLRADSLAIHEKYHWRMRLHYHPGTTPYQQSSRWFTPARNAPEECDFKTIDSTPPVISLTGEENVTIECGNTYNDAGATASDNLDGDISASIVVDKDALDINTPGTYTITYDLNDDAGNAATQVTRSVTVEDSTAPLISLLGPSSISVECQGDYEDFGATAWGHMRGRPHRIHRGRGRYGEHRLHPAHTPLHTISATTPGIPQHK